MKTHLTTTRPSAFRLTRLAAATVVFATLSLVEAAAQSSYSVVMLASPGNFDLASDTNAGVSVGSTATGPALAARAALWNGTTYLDLHPGALLGSMTASRSTAAGVANGFQVGSGAGPATANRSVALVWRGSAESAAILNLPFTYYSAQALATDGVSVVGSAYGYERDGTSIDTGHAMLWDLATGTGTDLGKGGQAFGVAGGQQVGHLLKGSANAALWRGTARSLVSLHPKNATSSSAAATDGARQVGNAGYEVRVRTEAANGNHSAIFTYATVWSGSAASAVNIHDGRFRHTYALGVSGPYIVGYGADQAAIGTPAYFHALVWDANLIATDLNAFLPAGFVGATAYAVDSSGFIAGYAMSSTGQRRAVIWIPRF